MNIRRIDRAPGLPDPFEDDPALQQAATAPSHGHHRHALSRPKRQSLRKRRGAESPDATDPGAESEDLLQMLHHHLQLDQRGTMRVGAQDSDSRHQSFDQHDNPADAQTNTPASTAEADGRAHALPMRLVTHAPREEAVLLAHWRAAPVPATSSPLQRTVAALHGVRAASAARHSPPATGAQPLASSTYPILAIVREFLRLPDNQRTQRATLAQVRDRLIAASPRAGAAERHTPSASEESMNLLLPILLLNLGRSRTRQERAIGISTLAALIRRGRGW